jgi:protein gp37
MAENSAIEWTDHTFNPWRGCTKVSPGCANCYAEALSKRTGHGEYRRGVPRERMSVDYWKQPLRWNREAAKTLFCLPCVTERFGEARYNAALGGSYGNCQGCGKPKNLREFPVYRPRVFCASLADWLDDEVPIEWLADLLNLIHATQNLDWLLLTKRPQNWRDRCGKALMWMSETKHIPIAAIGWLQNWVLNGVAPTNVWAGTTVENQKAADSRIPDLLEIPAQTSFLSMEPLLGPVDLTNVGPGARNGSGEFCCNPLLGEYPYYRESDGEPCVHYGSQIHWVICGGESGPKSRPMHPDWARSLRDQCQNAGVPFFFKQWGEWREVLHHEKMIQLKVDGSEYSESFAALCNGFLSHSGHFVKSLAEIKDNVTYRGLERIGKKKAGRVLDGQEWSEFPS